MITCRRLERALVALGVVAFVVAATALLPRAGGAQAASGATPGATLGTTGGAYLATSIDSAALPLSDRVTDDEGTTYLVQFDRLVLSLRSENRFRASIQFRRTIVSNDRRAQLRPAPLQTMSVTGTYEVVGTQIRFDPDATGDARGLRMLAGTILGPRRITVPFDYRNGAAQRRRVLELHRRDDIL